MKFSSSLSLFAIKLYKFFTSAKSEQIHKPSQDSLQLQELGISLFLLSDELQEVLRLSTYVMYEMVKISRLFSQCQTVWRGNPRTPEPGRIGPLNPIKRSLTSQLRLSLLDNYMNKKRFLKNRELALTLRFRFLTTAEMELGRKNYTYV